MSAPIVQANYDDLAQIAGRFGQAADRCAELERQVQGAYAPLADGGWLGRGAGAFIGTMEGELFPALQRLQAALVVAREVTLQARAILLDAEGEAAALFQGSAPGGDKAGAPETLGPQGGNPLATLGLAALKVGWQLFKDRNSWRALFQGLRFVKDGSGLWRLLGSSAAKTAAGLPANLTRFGQAAIKRNLDHFSVLANLKNVAVGKGPFADRAAQLLKGITTTAPLTPAADFMARFKGAAGVSTAITALQNIYEFGWGAKKETGLLSRQFVTATTADVSAGLGIVAASTAIGTLIPVPGVGTAAGFIVGLGLQYAYDTWGKEAWRGVVDKAGQYVQEQGRGAYEQVSRFGRDMSRAAYDATSAIGGDVVRTGGRLGAIFSNPTSALGGALRGAGTFLAG